MSKVIEELDNLIYGGQENPITISFDVTKFFQVIGEVRNELQRLEAIDNANPSEALKCWQWINATIPQWVREKDKEHPNVLEPIKQALLKEQEQEKILKIIFEKNVDVYTLFDLGFEEYNKWVLQRYGTYYQLIEEEFELLKEVLENE